MLAPSRSVRLTSFYYSRDSKHDVMSDLTLSGRILLVGELMVEIMSTTLTFGQVDVLLPVIVIQI